MSHRAAIYYADLTVRDGVTLEEAIAEAQQNDVRRKAVGFDQMALDVAGREGFGNGAFEECAEDIAEIVEEFFPATDGNIDGANSIVDPINGVLKEKPSLKEKLDKKAVCLNG